MIIIKKDQLTRQVTSLVAQALDVNAEKVSPGSNYLTDLGGHSLSLTELRVALEKQFKITIPVKDAARLLTVGQTVDYVTQKTASRG